MMRTLFLVLTLFSAFQMKASTDTDTLTETLTEEQMMAMYQVYIDSIENTLTYETGSIAIGDDLALLVVPEGYKFLIPKDAEKVLTELWGNPPSDPGSASMGMLFPQDVTPMGDNMYAINITYSEEGYIDDADAKELDYDELLEEMKEDTDSYNPQRVELGYEPIEFVGWASTPFYDENNKKLHWAQELKFGDAPTNTLNYNIRVLGRKGYLNLNVIGDMEVLPRVKGDIDGILPSINFQYGSRYSDFNPDIDQVAAYGIGGLIAGKVLAKAGILAKLGLLLAKFWKVIAVAIVAGFAGLRKLFTGGSSTT